VQKRAVGLALIAASMGAALASAQELSGTEATGGTSATTEAVVAALDPLTAEPSVSTSVGGPSSGTLTGGVPLPLRAPGLVSNPRRPNPEAFYGTIETVRALVRAAAAVHRDLPGSDLVINDIGFRQGGVIPHHGSHQAGRDVDVLFYYFDRQGRPFPSKGIPVDPEGRGWDFADLAVPRDDVRVRLDTARTWRFVQAMLEDDIAGTGGLVQRIFVVEHVRTLLLAEAARVRAPRAVVARFSDVSCQPAVPHDDHLHVRFFCSDDDVRAGCADASPMYPWRRDQLRALGLEPVMAAPRPSRGRSRTVSPEEAVREAIREAGGRVHDRVRSFLEQRAVWSVPPHPGRRWCR
jgi:penicillin-insensitive murein endopeptidase